MRSELVRRLLLIEDNPGDARLLRELLNEQDMQHIELTHVEYMRDAEKHLAERTTDMILLDLGLPDVQGLEAVRRAHAAAPHVTLVVLSGMDDESLALQAMQNGAQDYLIKGQIEPRELVRALRYAVERKIIEESLWAEKERAQATLQCIGDAVVSTDAQGNIFFLNPVAETMTGWSLQEATGRPMAEVFRIVDANTHETVPDTMERAVQRALPGHLPWDCALVRRDGLEIPVEDSVSPIHDRDGRPTGAVVVFRDVSAARAMTRQMAHDAAHDYLTGLPNRLHLKERISNAIASADRHKQQVALLYLDLDGFKHINDSLGHLIGDKVLQSVAKRLLNCVRAPDTVSRQGGDEFLILLSEVDHPDGSAIVANRILHRLGGAHTIDKRELHVTASIGVSVYPDDGLDAESLIKNADTAMFQAKEDGTQNYRFFTPAMNIRAVERQSIEEDLRRAVERKELELHYQPKVNLESGEITGAEALIRWMHPTRGTISPAQFIPIAEDCGLIRPIGAWVLHQACTQAQAWSDAGLPAITMAVNVSAIQFRDENFLEGLFAILGETGLSPELLELEVTEGVLMKQAEFTTSILQTVREAGIRVSVDDFGTGYSSLGYLHRFPLDALKIDQSFVRQIAVSPNETTIVSAIISMGQSLRLRVIAEGVETPEQLEFLRTHHCDEAQGYYFSRPVPAEKFAQLLREGCFSLKCEPAAHAA
jgi:diguanylate cyclase (GGDEF)-like protein/PAS domain S-box-containing protein